jgi:chemotaxis signal transduction protein
MAKAVMAFRVSGTWLAVDALRVWEVLGPQPWIAIPGASAAAPGVLGWRGKAVAVVDLGAVVLGAGTLRAGETAERTLIAEAAECSLAIPAQAVREVQEVGDYRLEPVHAAQLRCVAGEVELDGKPVPLVDLDAMVDALAGAAT